jgi:hypothetical protein
LSHLVQTRIRIAERHPTMALLAPAVNVTLNVLLNITLNETFNVERDVQVTLKNMDVGGTRRYREETVYDWGRLIHVTFNHKEHTCQMDTECMRTE